MYLSLFSIFQHHTVLSYSLQKLIEVTEMGSQNLFGEKQALNGKFFKIILRNNSHGQ